MTTHPYTLAILTEHLRALRLAALATLTGPPNRVVTAVTCAVYFFMHRVYLAFHRASMTRPPLTKGDPTGPIAHHHRLSVLHMHRRIDRMTEERELVSWRSRSPSPSRSPTEQSRAASPAPADHRQMRVFTPQPVAKPAAPKSRPSTPAPKPGQPLLPRGRSPGPIIGHPAGPSPLRRPACPPPSLRRPASAPSTRSPTRSPTSRSDASTSPRTPLSPSSASLSAEAQARIQTKARELASSLVSRAIKWTAPPPATIPAGGARKQWAETRDATMAALAQVLPHVERAVTVVLTLHEEAAVGPHEHVESAKSRAAAADLKIAELEARNAQLATELDTVNVALQQLLDDRDALAARCSSAESDNAQLTSDLTAVRAARIDDGASLSAANAAMAELQAQLDASRASNLALAQQLESAATRTNERLAADLDAARAQRVEESALLDAAKADSKQLSAQLLESRTSCLEAKDRCRLAEAGRVRAEADLEERESALAQSRADHAGTTELLAVTNAEVMALNTKLANLDVSRAAEQADFAVRLADRERRFTELEQGVAAVVVERDRLRTELSLEREQHALLKDQSAALRASFTESAPLLDSLISRAIESDEATVARLDRLMEAATAAAVASTTRKRKAVEDDDTAAASAADGDQTDDDPEYEVEAILDVKRAARTVKYLVEWVGGETTWEYFYKLKHLEELLAEFHANNPDKLDLRQPMPRRKQKLGH
ncbi:hypothetical protein H9P43_009641 [Blastocladiella emersonii ATCC 22665]|nr:hypothetical protein H9P43_009641 [Blastocladiella emersonii ATCC 22665]